MLIASIVIVFAVLSLLFWDKRYRNNHGSNIPLGFEKTEEIAVDPHTGERFRVYYNPASGERFYHTEE